MIAEYIIHRTLENMLLLFGTHSKLVQMVLLVVLGIDILRVVSTSSALVHVGILSCIGDAICRLWSDLDLAPR